MDLAHIYWRGVKAFGVRQAEHYYETLFQRFREIAEAPYKYQTVDHIREGYRRSVCGIDSIYYRVNGDMVAIMRVLGRQNVENEL
jgi:toxin ParE1/3/4